MTKAPVGRGAHAEHLDRGDATGDNVERRTLGCRVEGESQQRGKVVESEKLLVMLKKKGRNKQEKVG